MDALRKNHKKFITLKQARRIITILVFVLFFDFLLFEAPALADAAMETANTINSTQANGGIVSTGETDANQEALNDYAAEFNGKLPKSDNIDVEWSKYTVITAYNSEPGQTDDSPCITANNFNVCDNGVEDTIAANFLPFGSKVKIPDLFGDRVFVVRDRMNRRFSHRVDVWMINRPDALHFGVKMAKIEVLQ